MKKLKLLDTFSGIGGFSYAAEKLVGGFKTTQFIEIDPYCQKVLKKHWPHVPIYDDISTFTATPLTQMTNKKKYFVRSINSKETHEWFLKKHYAKRIPNIMFCFGLYNTDKILQGVISFGLPASKPLVVGAFKGQYQKDFLELNRLCVEENLEKNSLSFFVSQSLKLLPKPKVIVSYADTSQNHHGYIYQATNWIYTGLSDVHKEWRMYGSNIHSKNVCKNFTLQERKDNPNKFYIIDRPRKHRYFYLIGNKKEKKEMIKNLFYKVEPYPKGNNKKYKAGYKPDVQILLF